MRVRLDGLYFFEEKPCPVLLLVLGSINLRFDIPWVTPTCLPSCHGFRQESAFQPDIVDLWSHFFSLGLRSPIVLITVCYILRKSFLFVRVLKLNEDGRPASKLDCPVILSRKVQLTIAAPAYGLKSMTRALQPIEVLPIRCG